jgi:hypothetical protein
MLMYSFMSEVSHVLARSVPIKMLPIKINKIYFSQFSSLMFLVLNIYHLSRFANSWKTYKLSFVRKLNSVS